MQDLTPQEIIARDRSRLAAALQTGVVQNPDEEAGLRREAQQRGMDPEVLRTARAQRTPLPPPALSTWYDMPERAPSTAGFLSNPQNAAIAHDDTDNLSLAEQTMSVLKNIGGSLYSGLPRLSAGIVGRVEMAEDFSDAVLGAPFRAVESLLGTNVGERNRQFVRQQRGDYRRYLSSASDAALAKSDNPIVQAAYSGVASIAPSALGVLAGIFGGPAAGAAVIAAPVGGEAYGRARDEGKGLVPAAAYAETQAGAEFLGERIGLGPLLGGLKMGSPFLQTFVKTQIAEQVGEQATTVLQDFADYAMMNPDQTFAEFLAERPDAALQTAVATAVGSGATTTGAYAVQAAAQRLDRNDRQRRAAMRDSNLVQQLNAVAEASKVRARSPETFEEFVGELAQDGPVDTLYVDAQTFNQTLEDAGIRVADVEAAVPAVAEQLSNALRDGGDLAIPVEQFAARISGTDFAQPLLDHLRVNPALPSRAEVMALGQEANAALQAEVEAVLTAEVTTDAFRQSAERVKQSLLEQLNTAGRFTKDVNDAYASLPAAYYTVRAAQLGITPEEMAARYPLQIRAELPTAAGAATLDQEAQVPRPAQNLDELTTLASEAGVDLTTEMRGDDDILLQWIARTTGEAGAGARVMEALTDYADARGMTITLGITDDEGASALEGYYESYGFERDNPEDDYDRIMTRYPAEGIAEFNQSEAPVATDSAAFKAWFGDSKVVDENGEPLVVYHGTRAEFDAFKNTSDKPLENLLLGRAHYFSSDPDYARIFGDRVGAYYISASRIINEADLPREAYDFNAERDEEGELGAGDPAAWARANGYDAIRAGGPGWHLAVLSPTQIKSVFNRGTFDPNDPRILFQRNRGQIAFAGDITQSPSVISLLRTADLSTFLHETGHYFLEVDAYIASQPDAPAEVVADVNRLLAWFGVEDLATWNAKPVEEKRQFHEQFARGFEMFLLEGRSPTPELQTLFQRFRSWLLNVYKSLTSLNVELTDEVRDVMGRMLASAEAIQNAEDVRHFKPLAETRPPYMTEQAWDEYQRAFAAATAEGLDTLSTRTVRDMKWLANARSRALKRLQAQANDARRQVRAEVTAEVNAEPVNRARRFITRGTDENNEPIPGAGKLDLATLREMYGESEDALWRQLRRGGKYGEAGNDGIHPDVVAENFGFASGDALVRALISAENAQDKIAGLTDQRMLERYGDIADEQAMDRATDEAIANDARARVLATEYAALAEATGQPRALAAAARQYAAGIVNRIELKRLKPHQFFAASARAGRQADAALKKDDLGAAATAKRNQLVNMQAARYTLDAKREVDQALTLYKRIIGANDEALAKSRDMALVNATRALLAQYGLTRMKNDPMGYLERVKEYDPELYEDIKVFLAMGPAEAKPFADMTFEEFQGMHEVVRQLWALSRRSRMIELEGKLVDLNTARKELGDHLDALGEYPQERIGMARAATDKDKRNISLLSIRASLRRVESWVRAVDAGDNGPFRRIIWNPISEAADRYRAAKGDLIRGYLDIIKDLEGTLTGAKIDATEIGYTFKNRAELLHAILHTGNNSNLSKLLLGRGWGSKAADGSLDTTQWDAFVSRMWAEGKLTKADYDFAQKVWDLLDSMKPGAQAAHRAVYGRYFSEVTADELVTPFGTYRGGYVPATADAELVADAARRRGQRALEETPSSMFPAASNGFTQSRNEDYTKPLKLDLGLLGGHIDSVLKFTYMAAPVRDAARLLKGDALSDKLFAFDPKAETDLLLPFLSRAALQTVEVPAKTEGGRATARFFRGLRARVGMQLMFANVSNAMQQFTGVFPLALRLKKTQIARAAVFYFKNPEHAAQAVNEKSLFMRNRTSTQMFEVMNEIDDMLLDPSKYDKLRAYATQHAYFLQSFTQNHVDFIAWGGAYDAAISRGEEEKEAIRFADSVIRETQGTLAPEDVAAVETQQAFVRSFLQFYNFFNVMANLNATEVMIVKRTTGLKQGAGRLFYIYMMGFAAQALIADAIAGLFRGGWEDDEDDGYLDEFLIWFFGGQAKFAAAMVPGVGQAANAAIGLATTKAQYDDRVSVSPSVSLFESFIRVPFQAYKSVFEGEDFDRRDVRDTMTLLGVLTKLPLGAVGRPVGYGVGVAQGDIQPTGPLDVARGLVTGAPSPESRTN